MKTKPQFGPLVTSDGVEFRLWAPQADSVQLIVDDETRAMNREQDGWFRLKTDAAAGARYAFLIDGKTEVPDPASHFQPDDVHGRSMVIDHSFAWHCANWRGRPWHEAVILELHVGTFTEQGTFTAIIDKLDHLVETGITAIELMPVADFPGRWNWGYDGVLLYAPDSAYGTPNNLKQLIDEAHARGLMVFLDVVYNHFGPDGNYLSLYAPPFFTDAHTPWGSAIDYRVPQVRAFAIENALHWLKHYRFDGLRLDAVHAIVQPGEPELLRELSESVAALASAEDRLIHLVLENDDNRAALLNPQGGAGYYRAQWNDDYHHAFHVLLTGERSGYYSDYTEPLQAVARALTQGFVYQGEVSQHRGGTTRGESSRDLSPLAFVNFLQNHDQIGNRAKGDRLSSLAKPEAYRCALTLLLLSPSIPMLYIGEEWGTETPFPFFCDFKGELAEAVRAGRHKEFADAYAESGHDIPDPFAETTIRAATLNWNEAHASPFRDRLSLVRELLTLRRDVIIPLIPELIAGQSVYEIDEGVIDAKWPARTRTLRIVANLSDEPRTFAKPITGLIWPREFTESETLPAWATLVCIETAS